MTHQPGVQHLLRFWRFDAHTPEDLELLVPLRIRHVHLHEETVPLRLGKRVDPLGLDRVLGRDHDERFGRRIGPAADGDLFLGHQLEHRGLHLRGRPVDLVGQHEIHEHRSELDLEGFGAGGVDAGSDDVGGNQVRGELHPGEIPSNNRCEGTYRQGFRHTRYSFEKTVALRQESHHQLLDHVFLPDDDPLHLTDRHAQEASCVGGGGGQSWLRAGGSQLGVSLKRSRTTIPRFQEQNRDVAAEER